MRDVRQIKSVHGARWYGADSTVSSLLSCRFDMALSAEAGSSYRCLGMSRRRADFDLYSMAGEEWGVPSWGEERQLRFHEIEPNRAAILFFADEPPVRGPAGSIVPKTFWGLFYLPPSPPFQLALAIEDGELVCTKIVVGRAPGHRTVSATSLRQIALKRAMAMVVSNSDFTTEMDRLSGEQFLTWIDYRGGLGDVAHVPRRGKRLDDEHYQHVAEIYLDARTRGAPPTDTVARRMYTARSNAGRWVMEARRRGHLPPIRPRSSAVASHRRGK
jgi:hypothetical protein